MGVSIHYRGQLDDIRQYAVLGEELCDIAAVMGWPSTSLDDDWELPADANLSGSRGNTVIAGHLGLKGVQITPGPKAESLSFFLDHDGNLRSPMSMVLILNGTLKSEQAWVSVKTQFLPAEMHVWIIGLLKYLKKRYISNLQVCDEGEYWETGDIRILKEKMDFIDEKLGQISMELSSTRFGDVSGMSAEQIASRIEQLLLRDENEKAEQEPEPDLK